jgi:hypothetical protein
MESRGMNKPRSKSYYTARSIPDMLQKYNTGIACLDCNADTELIEHETNVYTLKIKHDDTCPWLAQHEYGK